MQGKALFTAVALAALSAGAAAHDDQWASLDRDIEALAQAGPAQPTGMQIGALLRLLYGYANDTNGLLFPGIDDISGFAVERAQIDAEGQVEDYGFRLQLEAAGGTAAILDAYGTWQINEYVRTSMGSFRPPVLWESLLDDSNRLLILRTDAGEFFYQRDVGAMVDGTYDRFHWAGAIQNGLLDGVGDEYRYTARLGLDILGAGVGMQQGAYGLEEGTDLTWNVAILDETAAPEDGTLYSTDAQLRIHQFSADAQFIRLPDDQILLGDRADAGLWAATVAYMIVPEKYEIAVRYQDTDNIDNDSEFTIGVNRYIVGHDVKWQLNFASADSDREDKEFDVLLIGLNVRV